MARDPTLSGRQSSRAQVAKATSCAARIQPLLDCGALRDDPRQLAPQHRLHISITRYSSTEEEEEQEKPLGLDRPDFLHIMRFYNLLFHVSCIAAAVFSIPPNTALPNDAITTSPALSNGETLCIPGHQWPGWAGKISLDGCTAAIHELQRKVSLRQYFLFWSGQSMAHPPANGWKLPNHADGGGRSPTLPSPPPLFFFDRPDTQSFALIPSPSWTRCSHNFLL